MKVKQMKEADPSKIFRRVLITTIAILALLLAVLIKVLVTGQIAW